MKRVAFIFTVFLLASSFCLPGKKPLKVFVTGKYTYTIYEEDYYMHDDNMDASFFVVYRNGIKSSICSSWMKASRNDSTFTTGSFQINKKLLTFKEVYHYGRSCDSMMKTFSLTPVGGLNLKEVREYKQGVVYKTLY